MTPTEQELAALEEERMGLDAKRAQCLLEARTAERALQAYEESRQALQETLRNAMYALAACDTERHENDKRQAQVRSKVGVVPKEGNPPVERAGEVGGK